MKSIQNKLFKPNFMMSEFRNCTYSDVKRHKLICTKKVRRKGIIKNLIKWTVSYLGSAVAFIYLCDILDANGIIDTDSMVDMSSSLFPVVLLILIFCPMVLCPFIAVSYCFFAYLQTFVDETTYRTDEAEKINKNIEGLKNFLNDFSLISERERKEIENWDRYLVYSVMLGSNKKIVRDFQKYYD